MRRLIAALLLSLAAIAVTAADTSPVHADFEQTQAAWKSCPNGQYVQAVTKTMNTTRVTFTNTNNGASFTAHYLGSTNWLGFQNANTHTTLSWYQSAYVVVEANYINWMTLSCVWRA